MDASNRPEQPVANDRLSWRRRRQARRGGGGSLVRYLGIKVGDALEIAEQTEAASAPAARADIGTCSTSARELRVTAKDRYARVRKPLAEPGEGETMRLKLPRTQARFGRASAAERGAENCAKCAGREPKNGGERRTESSVATFIITTRLHARRAGSS